MAIEEEIARSRARDRLLEREAEVAALAALVEDVAQGEGRLALVEGTAGIGKSRLLAEVRQTATGAGLRILSARGGQLEQEFPFGVVRQLFEPALLDAAEREAALGGAAAGAEPVFEDLGGAGGDVSFAALHGLYWLTVNLASAGPLLLAVDDLHWADRPSLRYLAYLARRLDGLPVLLCGALRPAEPGADAALLGELAGDAGTVFVRPSALSEHAAREMVRRRLGGEVDDRFTAACHETTGGNPLLLRELVKALESEGVRPEATAVGLVREIGPRAASRAVLVRLARLSPHATAAARAVAVLDEGADLTSVAALAGLDEEGAAEATDALARSEILRPEPPLGFVHPLVRDAVYHDLPPGERTLAHARAADLLAEAGAAPERVAAHLLLVAPRGEPSVVETLGVAARAALASGGTENAIAYLRRALEEPPPPEARGEIVLALGSAEASWSAADALVHLREGLATLQDPARRAHVAFRIAWIGLFVGSEAESVALLREAIAELPSGLSDERRALEALGLLAAYFGEADLDELEGYRAQADRVDGEGAGAKMLLASRAFDLALQGAGAERCVKLALDGLAEGIVVEAESDVGGLVSTAGWITLVLADSESAMRELTDALEIAHRRGSLSAVMAVQLFTGFAHLRRGDLGEAERMLLENLERQRTWVESAARMGFFTSLGFLAHTRVEQGRLAEARADLELIGPVPPVPSFGADVWRYAYADLLLAEGRAQEALEVADEAWELRRWVDAPAMYPWRTVRARALDALGRTDEGVAAAREELDRAHRWGSPGPMGRALRVLGTLRRQEGVRDLQEAVRVLEGSPARLELAKALSALGTTLRLARRPSDAREPLRRALELADACGAQTLVEHTRSELYATGARPRSSALSGAQSLTASERRVADLAVEGHSNREIAQALYVTPKTVEVHLSNAYRKLDIGSRRELAGALGGGS